MAHGKCECNCDEFCVEKECVEHSEVPPDHGMVRSKFSSSHPHHKSLGYPYREQLPIPEMSDMLLDHTERLEELERLSIVYRNGDAMIERIVMVLAGLAFMFSLVALLISWSLI